MGGGLNAPSFWLELRDSGAGAVSTAASLSNGTATAAYTRASPAYTKLSSGLWASVASGQARSSYIGLNTAVSAYGGYLAEGSRTQLVTPTASIRDMTDASWVKVTMTAAKTATGIDGIVNSASTLTATAGTATILQTLVAAATSRAYSCWVKRRTGTGTIILKQGTATLDITALINSTTFTLVQLNDNELNVAYGLQINTNGDAVDVDFNQLEAGAFASTPLDTAGGARAFDVLTYPSAGNSDGTMGSVYFEFTHYSSAATGFVVALDQTQTTGCFIQNNTTLRAADGTNNADSTPTAIDTGVIKGAASWGPAGLRSIKTGDAIGTNSFDGSFGTNAQINVGCSGAAQSMFGYVQNIRIWTRQFSNGQLASLVQ